MWLMWYLFATAVAQDKLLSPPQMFMVDQSRSTNQIDASAIIQSPRLNVAPTFAGLNHPCTNNLTCNSIPNAYCHATNKTCQCLHNFIEDSAFPVCKLAPGYNEVCASGELECRQPFTCNSSSMCDCPSGYIQEYFQCIKDCPPGQIPIGEDCYAARHLNEKCDRNEQCVQIYSQCLRNKCQCIQGVSNVNGTCNPVLQCPIGAVHKTKKGHIVSCDPQDAFSNITCPQDHYCMQAEIAFKSGVCCPKIKMSCPIGQAMDGRDCSNCPWETHHCFSYIIGGFTETMCCPNACPTSHPIQKENKCYARSAFGGHCEVDEQCYNVLGALCRNDTESNSTTCQCPRGNYRFYFGRCLKDSTLGEKCSANEECQQGTNTRCLNGVCSCYETFIPEPIKAGSSHAPQRCIAEPSCPTVNGLRPVREYIECTDNPDVCKNENFCRQWWFDVNRTYALCCQKPSLDNYQSICKQFNLKLSMDGKTIKRCDIAPVTEPIANDAFNETENAKHCPVGVSCLFDPFTVNKGICCEQLASAVEPVVETSVESTVSPSVISSSVIISTPLTSSPLISPTVISSSAVVTEIEETTTERSTTKTRTISPKRATSNIPVIRIRSKKTN